MKEKLYKAIYDFLLTYQTPDHGQAANNFNGGIQHAAAKLLDPQETAKLDVKFDAIFANYIADFRKDLERVMKLTEEQCGD